MTRLSPSPAPSPAPGLLLALALLAPPTFAADGPLQLREVYVPYAEFRARVAGEPDGVVMQVDEYRTLVLAALAQAQEAPPPPLPPIGAAVVSARYQGELAGRTVRVRGTLVVSSADEGWTRCDLGTRLARLGSITAGGEPGWVLVEAAPGPRAAPAKGEPALRHYLLLRGKGEHRVEVTFSLLAAETDGRWSLASPLIPAVSSRFELEVPGRVEARSEPGLIAVLQDGDRSRLVVSAGSAESVTIDWTRKKALGQSEALLRAEHRVAYFLAAESPAFAWEATVAIARRKAESLTFAEPPLARVVSAEGPAVAAWERTEAGLRVILNEPTEGEVKVRFAGVIEAAGASFTLGPPRLLGAFSDAGHIALHAPADIRLEVESASLVEEVAADEAETPLAAGAAAGAAAAAAMEPTPRRLYSFRSGEARLTALLAAPPGRFESRAAFVLAASEASAFLEGALEIQVTRGRLYRFTLSLPEPWRLASLAEAPAQPDAARGLHHEERGQPGNRSIEVLIARGAGPGETVGLRLRLEHAAYGEDREGAQPPVAAGAGAELNVSLPAVLGAERSRTDLGIHIASSMDAVMADLPSWRALAAEEVQALGLDAALPAAAGLTLAAGLTTKDAAPALRFTLSRRPARGEYRLVLSLIALERQLRARADIQLAAVDRPIAELLFQLPREALDGAVIIGEGIKESRVDAAALVRAVRFTKPWLGTRQFRIEYEVPHQASARVAIPAIDVRPGGPGRFGGERFLLLQSRGPVEINVDPGPGLAPADVDDLPDFAEPWDGGRVLTAFRFRSTGDPGGLTTVIHERAPVLQGIAREVRLTTALGREGASRTSVEVLLATTRQQHLTVRLPAGARLFAVSVNDEPVRAVRPEASTVAGRGPEFSIPLPPRSYARIVLAYEQEVPSTDGDGLGPAGVLVAEGPVFPDLPVGKTAWTLYHPAGYRFSVAGGNLLPVNARDAERDGFFAESFLARILRGEPPLFTALARSQPRPVPAALPVLTEDEAAGAAGSSPGAGLLRARPAGQSRRDGPGQARRDDPGQADTTGAGTPNARKHAAPRYQLIAEGGKIEAGKIGGDAVFHLAYRREAFGAAARRAVFLGTILLGALIGLGGKRRALGHFVVWGLLVGTLLPLALGWSSPLLAVPFCEGLVVLAAGGIVLALAQALTRRQAGRAARVAATAGCIIAAVSLGSGLMAEEKTGGGAGAGKEAGTGTGRETAPFDGVLIPYDPEKGLASPAAREGEVYVPRDKFRELWERAHPRPQGEEEPPAELVLGSGDYRFQLESAAGSESYRLTGSILARVFTDRWVVLPLPFECARIVRVLVDGAEAGVGQGSAPDSPPGKTLPFLEFHGRGTRRIEIELAGPVERNLGEARAAIEVLAGAGATVRAELPRGAKVEARGPAGEPMPAPVTAGDGGTIAVLDLGSPGRAELRWSFPREEGDTGSQVESLSYTALELTFDGCAVDRRERVRVTGRPVDSLVYWVLGGWRVAEVSGVDLAEWSLIRDAAGERLQVFFSRPLSAAEIRIRGRALLDPSGPFPALSLAGAVKEETFAGLRHGALRRFAPGVLAGMRRASRDDLRRAFQLPDGESPDRIYHAFASGQDQTLAVERVDGELTAATEAVCIVTPDRQALLVRSRLTVTGPGPVRLEVALPADWSPRSASSAALRSWETVEAANGRRLVLHFRGRAPSGTEISWSAERTFERLPETVEVPPVRLEFPAGISSRESQVWVFAASEELDLAAREAGGLEAISPEGLAAWAALPPRASPRFAFRVANAATAASPLVRLGTAGRRSQLSAVVVSIARLAEESLEVNSRLVHRVRLGARDRFRFRLPPGAELVSIETRNQRSRAVRATPAGIEAEIVLQSPASGEHAIDVSYRLRREGRAAPALLPVAILDGDIRLTDVDAYAGVLQGAATLVSAASAAGLAEVEARDFPYLPEGVAAESLRPAFRALALDWSLNLAEEEIEVSRGPAAIIELAEISTLVGGDGVARTRAAYTVRARSLQFLLVELPPDAELWGVTLDGKPVAVGSAPGAGGAGRGLRIPLEHVGAASLDLEVAIVYEEKRLDLPAVRGKARLTAPRVLDTRVVESVWRVEFPGGYWVSSGGGNMREVASSLRYAKKVENLLGQLDKVAKTAKDADSARLRERADRELRRLEQTLGDNLAELEGTNRSAREGERAGAIGKDDLARQWDANDALIRRTQEAQAGLKQAREEKAQEQAAQGQAQAPQAPGKQEQLFQDAANYQKRAWLKNEQQQAREAPAEPPAAEVEFEKSLEGRAFRGLQGAQVAPSPRDLEVAEPKPIDATQGLKPPPEVAGAGAAPGLEAPPEATGREPYTFIRAGGDAEIVLSFTRKEVVPRAGAIAGLVIAAAAAVWGAARTRPRRRVRAAA